jgi:hypothetical protein
MPYVYCTINYKDTSVWQSKIVLQKWMLIYFLINATRNFGSLCRKLGRGFLYCTCRKPTTTTQHNRKQEIAGEEKRKYMPSDKLSRQSIEAGGPAPPFSQVFLQGAESAAVLRARDGLGVVHVQQREAQVRPHVRRRVRLVVQAVRLGDPLVDDALSS